MAIGYKDFVRKTVRELTEYFNLSDWNGAIRWELPAEKDEQTVAACIEINDKYLYATLYIGPALKKYWDNHDWVNFIDLLVHEFSHILTEPLYDIAIDAVTNTSRKFLEEVRERQTQRITVLILKGLPDRFKDGFNFPVKAKKKPAPKKKAK